MTTGGAAYWVGGVQGCMEQPEVTLTCMSGGSRGETPACEAYQRGRERRRTSRKYKGVGGVQNWRGRAGGGGGEGGALLSPSVPKGHRQTSDSLMCWMPKGIPMMETQRATPVVAWAANMTSPSGSQRMLPMTYEATNRIDHRGASELQLSHYSRKCFVGA